MEEPLKGKIVDFDIGFDGFREDDIKSAVEWLKDRIKPMDIPKGKNLVLETIDLAFPDLNTDNSKKENK